MGNYLFVHHFPKGFQASAETAGAASAWFEQLEPHLKGRTTRTAPPRQLGDPNAEPVPTAYEIITADDLEGAMALARAWPLLSRGGQLVVRELTTESQTYQLLNGQRDLTASGA
jgi:hypothetical protein